MLMRDCKQNSGRQRGSTEMGFSLIELLIVVAIILIIAAIAIPSFLRSRMLANETSAAASLRTISTAEATYWSMYGVGYAPLANLGGASPCVPSAATACYLDGLLSSGTKSGYTLTIATPGAVGTLAAPNPVYSVSAVPIALGKTGQRSFCSDQTGVIRFDATGAPPPDPCSAGALVPLQ